MGARSFVLHGETPTYIMIYRGWDRIVPRLLDDGYVEEWPIFKTKDS